MEMNASRRRTWFGVGIGIALLLLLFWFWPRPKSPLATPSVTVQDLSAVPGMTSGELFPLPFEGTPVPGRPEQPMPISPDIYASTELKIDGQLVGRDGLTLQSGQIVQVQGVIQAQKKMPRNMNMDGGLGLVSRATNERGWIIRWPAFFGGHTGIGTGKLQCEFDGQYKVPNEPGEYLLVVISSAHVGHSSHWALLAAQYNVIVK